MKSGHTLTDLNGNRWTVEATLGRGWSSTSWLVTNEEGDRGVLKVPFGVDDLEGADGVASLIERSQYAVKVTAELMDTTPLSFLAPVLARVQLSEHALGIIHPYYEISLEEQLRRGIPLSEVIDLCIRLLSKLAHGRADGAIHGNLHPRNIFLDDKGDIILTDAVGPAHTEAFHTLRHIAPGRSNHLPPEANGPASSVWDTWALCLVIYRAAMAPSSSDDPRKGKVIPLPTSGLTKIQYTSVRDAATARLRQEGTNRRFASRAIEELGKLLNRGLSPEFYPSPPYRFAETAELSRRLQAVDELIHPHVSSVSKVQLAADARAGTFHAGDDVRFSVNVGTTARVTAREDLTCGIKLVPLDDPEVDRLPVTDARYTVKQYPSGLWRFQFSLPGINPGRYHLSVAFTVKDSQDRPKIAEGSFLVRARPGWTAPTPEPEPEVVPVVEAPPEAHDEPVAGEAHEPRSSVEELHEDPPSSFGPATTPPSSEVRFEEDDDGTEVPFVEPLPTPVPAPVTSPTSPPRPAPVQAGPAPVRSPQPVKAPQPVHAPRADRSPQPIRAPEPVQAGQAPSRPAPARPAPTVAPVNPPPRYQPHGGYAPAHVDRNAYGTPAAPQPAAPQPNNQATLPSDPHVVGEHDFSALDDPMMDYPSPQTELNDLPDFYESDLPRRNVLDRLVRMARETFAHDPAMGIAVVFFALILLVIVFRFLFGA